MTQTATTSRKSATTLTAGDEIAIEPSHLANPEQAWTVTQPSRVRKGSQVWTTVRSTRKVTVRGRASSYSLIVVNTDAGALDLFPQVMCATR